MRIVITGAGGTVGRQLVPLLREGGANLLLVGRDPPALRAIFPDCDSISYEEIPTVGVGFDMVLHMAVINNDRTADWQEMERVNVGLVVDTCRSAVAAGIGTFVLVSSTHALGQGHKSAYASSKRMAADRLRDIEGIKKIVAYLPAVAGDELTGKLRHLNRLPTFLRGPFLSIVGALRPTVHVQVIADALLAGLKLGKTKGFTAVIISDGQQASGFFQFTKRLIDVLLSFLIIVLLGWAMLLIWIAIPLLSPGPGIFRQMRVGKGEKPFTCFKFRTMYISAPHAGTHEVSPLAVTPFGRFLRSTKLDELPQIMNVLRNEMSFVGPRPCLQSQKALIDERRAEGIFNVIPGITGFSQIKGLDMSDPIILAETDKQYLQLQSLVLDAKIMLRTALGSGAGDRVRS